MAQFDDTFSGGKMEEMRRREEERLIAALAAQNGYGYIDLRGVTINPEALFLISEEEARAGGVVPFETIRKRTSLATRNPNDTAAKSVITKLEARGYTVTIFMTGAASLEHGWSRYDDQKNTQAVVSGVLDINADNIFHFSEEHIQSYSRI